MVRVFFTTTNVGVRGKHLMRRRPRYKSYEGNRRQAYLCFVSCNLDALCGFFLCWGGGMIRVPSAQSRKTHARGNRSGDGERAMSGSTRFIPPLQTEKASMWSTRLSGMPSCPPS